MSVWSQNAEISGFIYIIEEGKQIPVEYGKVLLLNSDSTVFKGANINYDGTFKLVGNPGKYLISYRSPGLVEAIEKIEILAGVNPEIRKEMVSPIITIKQIEVVAFTNITTEINLTKEIKEDTGVKVAQTAEQIASSGSSDTKQALQKMSGISTTNSVLYVRGMGDRYNFAYLNGLPVPSPDPELKVIPMDIFPTSIIDVLEVNKLMGPNFYGDFSGGAINIRTKKVFRTPTFNLSVGSSANTISTFQNFTTYQGGKLDYLGFDDGTRSIPSEVLNASKENATPIYREGIYQSDKANIGTGFNDNFNTISQRATPGSSFKFEGGNYWKSQNENVTGRGFGFITMLSQSSNFSRNDGFSRFINAQNKLDYDFEVKSQSYNTSTTGLASVLLDVNKNHSISANYLFINNSEDNVSETWGYHRDFADNENGEGVYARRTTFTQNQIHNMQLIGSSKFLNQKLNLNWGGSYSITKSTVPDRRQIAAMYDDKNDNEHYRLLALDANHTHRFFSELDENETAAHVDMDYTLFTKKRGADSTVHSSMKLIIGGDYKSKERVFNFRQFNYLAKPLADEIGRNFNIYTPDEYLNDEAVENGTLRIEESANPGNGYQAFQDIIGGNIGVIYKLSPRLEVIPNVRIEKGFQSVKSRKQTQADKFNINTIDDLNLMPSLTTKYAINQNQLIRFGASRTITRPKFFELAPFEYIAQIAGKTQIGNPELQNGINYNGDLRYEIYSPKSADMISFGVFGKQLINPIEQVMRPSAGGQLISFANTNTGIVGGIEFEFAKNLAFLTKVDNREESILNQFSIAGNIAYIYSKISIDDTTGFTTSTERPLQGASPLMGNFSLKWENKIKQEITDIESRVIKLMAALTYSYTSKSLFAVGTQGMGDQYQFSSNNLNAVVGVSINRFSLGLTARNLTNNLYQIMQEDKVNIGEWQEVNAYKVGTTFSLNLTFKLL